MGNLKGHGSFEELLERKIIKLGTKISVIDGEDYLVNSQGQLEIMTTGEPPYKPQYVLSKDRAPNGWRYEQ